MTPGGDRGLTWQIGVWDDMAEVYVREIDRRFEPIIDHILTRAELRPGQRIVKLEDIVGLYVDPPKHTVVLSVRRWIAPSPGCRTRKAGTMTHDYIRSGVTTVFAALDMLEGTVLGRCMQRNRHPEFLCFLNTIEWAVPAGKVIQVVLDNYGSHKPSKVLRWLARHLRFVFHAVETSLSALTRRPLKRGSFRSILDLQSAMNRHIAEHNAVPRPFTWTKTAEQIMTKMIFLNAPVH